MQNKIILIFILLSHTLFSQDYNLINSNREYYYSFSIPSYWGNAVTGVSVDSFSVVGTDTSVFNYTSIFDLTSIGNCIKTYDTGFVGLFVEKQFNGTYIFRNYLNENISINSKIQMGDTNLLMKHGDNILINYFCSAIVYDTVISVLDSIKILSFYVTDTNNISINHWLNGRTIKLSKGNGMISCYDFLNFPEDTAEYNLVEITNPKLGLQNISMRDIYNFNVTDTMQWYGEFSNSAPYHTYTNEQKVILSKYESANLDTVTYTIDHISYTKYLNFSNVTINYTHDTLIETYIFSIDSVFTKRPMEFINVGNFAKGYSTLNTFDTACFGRRSKYFDNFEWYNPSDSCASFGAGWCVVYHTQFTEGLGITFKSDLYFFCGSEAMTYYHKGNQVCGSYRNFSSITSLEIANPIPEFNIFPSPATDEFTISNLFAGDNIVIRNLIGQIIWQGEADGIIKSISVSNWNAGSYIVTVNHSSHSSFKRFTKM